MNPILHRHGDLIDLGTAITGRNLNVVVLRGFAPLDVLAQISAPDVYDQKTNPTGTQRDLNQKHAQECYDYAVGALALTAEETPRAFPEIILNARDSNVVEVYALDDEGTVLDISSLSGEEELEQQIVGIRVRASELEFPAPPKSPQISRVDGNHRLHQTDEVLKDWAETDGSEDLDQDFPLVPYTLLIGLDHMQEAHLFRDINGEHQGMETAHLDTMTFRILDPEQMKTEPRYQALWLAHKLTEPGRAFDGMVFFGGSKAGLKKEAGSIPPIKINALKSTVAAQLKAAPTVGAQLRDTPEALLELLDRFWLAVRELFPDAWANRRDYILLQAIGLGAFAKFGGIVLERSVDAGQVTYDDIKGHIVPVGQQVSLKREDYPGIAGAGGAGVIADLLIQASNVDQVKVQKVIQSLEPTKPAQTALDD